MRRSRRRGDASAIAEALVLGDLTRASVGKFEEAAARAEAALRKGVEAEAFVAKLHADLAAARPAAMSQAERTERRA